MLSGFDVQPKRSDMPNYFDVMIFESSTHNNATRSVYHLRYFGKSINNSYFIKMPSQKFLKYNFFIESLLDGSSSHQFIRSKYCKKVIQLFILQDQNCFSRKYIKFDLCQRPSVGVILSILCNICFCIGKNNLMNY